MTFQRYKKYSDYHDDGRTTISDFNRIGLTRRQQYAIEYLKEENRILRERLGRERLRFTDNERLRLAVKAKVLGRKKLKEIACIVTPDTLLRSYRQLVAQKYDSSKKRGPGRPRVIETIRALVVTMALDNPTRG